MLCSYVSGEGRKKGLGLTSKLTLCCLPAVGVVVVVVTISSVVRGGLGVVVMIEVVLDVVLGDVMKSIPASDHIFNINYLGTHAVTVKGHHVDENSDAEAA